MKFFIVGGTGSLGKKLIDRLLEDKNNEIGIYSRDEAKQWTLKNDLSKNGKSVNFYVGDIRDFERLKDAIFQFSPDVVISAAALKQVDVCELNPEESIKTNLLGTKNVIKAFKSYVSYNEEKLISLKKKKTLLFVSTDKACSPINTYGMCKAISERLITSESKNKQFSTVANFICVRYGNVLESRGSIIPLFRYQAENCDFITVTNPDMTRFMMTLDESVDLILTAIKDGNSGETWIPKLRSMKISDIAEIFSESFKKKIKKIDERPGEKMHEDLINESESTRSIMKNDFQYYAILPSYESPKNLSRYQYSSDNKDSLMSKKELQEYLKKINILDMPLEKFVGRTIEEIYSPKEDVEDKK